MRTPRKNKPATCAEAAQLRKFAIGDVVQLNSGGLRMTVLSQACCGELEVAFAEYGAMNRDYLPEECLKAADLTDDEIPF